MIAYYHSRKRHQWWLWGIRIAWLVTGIVLAAIPSFILGGMVQERADRVRYEKIAKGAMDGWTELQRKVDAQATEIGRLTGMLPKEKASKR